MLEVLAFAGLVALLAVIQLRHRRRVRRERGTVFGACAGLLSEVAISQDGIGYPTLRGRWRDHEVKLDLVVDTLAMRQLPTLWLLVTLKQALPVLTPVDITLRPRSSDIVSASLDYDYEHRPPPGWPDDIRIATPSPALPPLERVDGLAPLLAQPSTKSVLIAPGGIRVAHELARGAVTQYRVGRRPAFSFTLEPARVAVLLGAAEEIAARVCELGAPVSVGAVS